MENGNVSELLPYSTGLDGDGCYSAQIPVPASFCMAENTENEHVWGSQRPVGATRVKL